MKWLEYTVEVPAEAAEAAAWTLQEQFGFAVLEELERNHEIARWRCHMVHSDGAEQLVGLLAQQLRGLSQHGLPRDGYVVDAAVIEFSLVPETASWIAPDRLRVDRATPLGKKVVVKDVDDACEARPGQVVIGLIPSAAFGNGAHATTRMMCEALEHRLKPGDRVVDVGTGSGVLALAAAALGASSVLALDIEDEAVQSARDNAQRNAMSDRIVARRSDGGLRDVEAAADVVLANVLVWALKDITADVLRILAPGGAYVASGIMETDRDDMLEFFARHPLEITGVDERDGWICICMRKKMT